MTGNSYKSSTLLPDYRIAFCPSRGPLSPNGPFVVSQADAGSLPVSKVDFSTPNSHTGITSPSQFADMSRPPRLHSSSHYYEKFAGQQYGGSG